MKWVQKADGWYLADSTGAVLDGPYTEEEARVFSAAANIDPPGGKTTTPSTILEGPWQGASASDLEAALKSGDLPEADFRSLMGQLGKGEALISQIVKASAPKASPEFSTRKFAQGWAIVGANGNRVSDFYGSEAEARDVMESGQFRAPSVIQPPSLTNTGSIGGQFYPGAGIYSGGDVLTAAKYGGTKDAPTPPAVSPQTAMNTLIASGMTPEDALARLKNAGIVTQGSTLEGLAQLGQPASTTGGPPPTLAQTQAGLAAGTTQGAIQASNTTQGQAQTASTGNPFLDALRPIAEQFGAQYGIPPEVLLAINASETNWGAAGGLNGPLFGIKGPGTSYDTHEVNPDGSVSYINDSFRSYNSPQEAYQDFFNLVSTVPRYADAWKKLQAGDWQGFMQGINQAGYATDPNWATMITGLAQNIAGGQVPAGTTSGQAATGTQEGTGLTGITPLQPVTPLTPEQQAAQNRSKIEQWAADRGVKIFGLEAGQPFYYAPNGNKVSLGIDSQGNVAQGGAVSGTNFVTGPGGFATVTNPGRSRQIEQQYLASGQPVLTPEQAAIAARLGLPQGSQFAKETASLNYQPTLSDVVALMGGGSVAGPGAEKSLFSPEQLQQILTPREGFARPVPSDVDAIVNQMRQAQGLPANANILSIGGELPSVARGRFEQLALKQYPEVPGDTDDKLRQNYVDTRMAGNTIFRAEEALKKQPEPEGSLGLNTDRGGPPVGLAGMAAFQNPYLNSSLYSYALNLLRKRDNYAEGGSFTVNEPSIVMTLDGEPVAIVGEGLDSRGRPIPETLHVDPHKDRSHGIAFEMPNVPGFAPPTYGGYDPNQSDFERQAQQQQKAQVDAAVEAAKQQKALEDAVASALGGGGGINPGTSGSNLDSYTKEARARAEAGRKAALANLPAEREAVNAEQAARQAVLNLQGEQIAAEGLDQAAEQAARQGFLNFQSGQTQARLGENQALIGAEGDIQNILDVALGRRQRQATDYRFGPGFAGVGTPIEILRPLGFEGDANLPPGVRFALETNADRLRRQFEQNERSRGLELEAQKNTLDAEILRLEGQRSQRGLSMQEAERLRNLELLRLETESRLRDLQVQQASLGGSGGGSSTSPTGQPVTTAPSGSSGGSSGSFGGSSGGSSGFGSKSGSQSSGGFSR